MMAHPYDAKAKTNQERADARYGSLISPNRTPKSDPVLEAAERNPRNEVPDGEYNGASTRQVCNDGKVRK